MGLVQRLDVVLDAAKILQDSAPRARLILVGGGVDCVRLVQRARTLQLTNVTFLPRQPRHEMGRLMSVSHLGLVHLQNDPLFRITIPSKIQAYLREGLPILVAVDGDAKEVVERARAGVGCRSEDAKALADAIAELSRVPTEELRQMGIRGREFYDREMSCQAGVGRLELYLRQVVAEHSAKQGRSA
jgi:glycosyltransferase involved in cell wall biosynthesis